jgi:hypothetical protein
VFRGRTQIIQAEDSIFHVSKGVLVARLPVLKAMLVETPRMFGCTLLELPHSTRSVICFLKAIFDAE